ncbi:MAG: hypothetical protein Q4F18_01070, partial [Clostridia bacterium]|nr:hypothetical protein [Clostridia bacterium]
ELLYISKYFCARCPVIRAILHITKSAPCALPLPNYFIFQSISVLAARLFAQFPVSKKTAADSFGGRSLPESLG